MTGALLALAYPDRIGRRRPGTAGRYLLSGGRGAALPEGDPLGNEEFLVVADLDGAAQDGASTSPRRSPWARSRTFSPIASSPREVVRWGTREQRGAGPAAAATGALVLEDKPLGTRPIPKRCGRRCSTACASGPRRPAVDRRARPMAPARRLPAPALDESLARSFGLGAAGRSRDLAGAVPRRRHAARTWRGSISPRRSKAWCRGSKQRSSTALAPTHVDGAQWLACADRLRPTPPSRFSRYAYRRCSVSPTRRASPAARCRS